IKDEAVKASLIGLKKGDEVTLDIQKAFNNDAARVAGLLKIEEDLAADLKSNFRLTVKNVNRLEESDLNQEFFDKLFGEGEVTTEEEFRQRITGEIEAMMAQDAERRLQEDIYKYTLNKVQFSLPDDFLKRWLQSNDEKMTAEDLEGGYSEFAQNLKWTLIVSKIITEHKIEVKYEDVFETAKFRLGQQFRMYSQLPLSEEQLGQYTVQYLQNKENANKIFDEVKALKVFNYIKGVVTLEPKEISNTDFQKLF
ncbi:MAG TPA: trigger factor, partial [Mucilaginibacter sp.]|nr:trigger factor [Mucilaginibacter sp.]